MGVSHLSFSGHFVDMNYTFLQRLSSIGIHFCINCEIPEGGVNEASSGVEAADASVSVDSEVVAKRVSHPDSDQLGQPRPVAEQRRYQEESS